MGVPVRRAFTILIAFGCAAVVSAGSLYVLELKGGARVFALDRPLEKGRILVFHRHPDGVFTSISSVEVARIAPASAADRTEKFQPGELMVLGHDVEGPVSESGAPSLAPPAARAAYSMPDYGYGSYVFYGTFGNGGGHRPSLPTPAPRPLPPPLVGPNGYPGTPQRPIGSNGFPIIAPQREPQPR
jgi:hypothetical protein